MCSRPQRAGGGTALKLKKKDKDVDTFVDKLVREGEKVTSVTAPRQPSVTAKNITTTPQARSGDNIYIHTVIRD